MSRTLLAGGDRENVSNATVARQRRQVRCSLTLAEGSVINFEQKIHRFDDSVYAEIRHWPSRALLDAGLNLSERPPGRIQLGDPVATMIQMQVRGMLRGFRLNMPKSIL